MTATNSSAVRLDQAWDELHRDSRFLPLYPTEWVVRFLGRHIAGKAGARVLDLGCGGGRHSLLAHDLGLEVVSFDVSIEGLRATSDRLSTRGVDAAPAVGRFDRLPFADASFDAVVAYGVLLYGDHRAFCDGVDEMHRVLRPGGWAHAMMRTTDDHRFGMGAEVERNTFVLDSDETNEEGMLMHFLDRRDIDHSFANWQELRVERNDHTAGGGSITNSDWIIEVNK